MPYLISAVQFENMNLPALIEASITWDTLRSAWDADDLEGLGLTEHAALGDDVINHNAEGASQELEARLGAKANNRLATYLTASHASPEDALRLARTEPSFLIQVMRGVEPRPKTHRR